MDADGRRTDGRRLGGYTISSPCEPNGSGELKITVVSWIAKDFKSFLLLCVGSVANAQADLSSGCCRAQFLTKPRHTKNCCFAYAKTKTQISCTVIEQLISAVAGFPRYIDGRPTYKPSSSGLNSKFQAFTNFQCLCSPICVRPGWKPEDRPVFLQRGSISLRCGSIYDVFIVGSPIGVFFMIKCLKNSGIRPVTWRP